MNAVAYCRFSSFHQRDESIDAQLRAIKEYCKRKGYNLVNSYEDRAMSGTTDKRPSFLQMISDSAKGLFDIVIVHKLDRFARNRYDSAIYKHKLRENGVHVESVLEQLDGSPESVLLESAIEGISEYYSRNLARETMKGLKENALKCKHNGGYPPFGYDVDPETKKYIINEFEATGVNYIFSSYLEGKSYSVINTWLNSHGYITKRNKPFGKTSLHEILKNDKYIGIYTFNRCSRKHKGKYNSRIQKAEEEIIRIEGGIPQIIENDVWGKVQQRIKSRQQTGRNPKSNEYLLTGKIFCECSSSMHSHTNGIYRYYICNTHSKDKTACINKGIRADELELEVLKTIQDRIFRPDRIEYLVNDAHEYYKKHYDEITTEQKLIESKLEETNEKIENLIDLVSDGIKVSNIKKRLESLDEVKTTLETELVKAQIKSNAEIITKDNLRDYLNSYKGTDITNISLEEKKHIVSTFLHKLKIHQSHACDIEINVYISGCGGRI